MRSKHEVWLLACPGLLALIQHHVLSVRAKSGSSILRVSGAGIEVRGKIPTVFSLVLPGYVWSTFKQMVPVFIKFFCPPSF